MTNGYRSKGPATDQKKEVTTHERKQHHAGTKTGKTSTNPEALRMSRGPRPHRALSEAIPIAKERGIVQLAGLSPERIYDISIISKVPVTFARVMFAPSILATILELGDDFKEEIAQLRIIARDAAITAELWTRSRHGTWRFFVVTANTLVEIGRDGKPIMSDQTIG